jgi:hypothetical protein|tara:strand:+ start:2566 stop:2811 length:246 start_codon:yes stop_codon:yes gene_type:complete
MTVTAIFMLIAVLSIAIFDVFIIAKKGKYESISAYIIRGSKKYPLVVLLLGIVLGHLFWSMDSFDHLPKEELIKKCNEVLK